MAEKTVSEIFETLNEEQKRAAYYLVGHAIDTGINYLHGSKNDDEHGVIAEYDGMNIEQKALVTYLINDAIKKYEKGD